MSVDTEYSLWDLTLGPLQLPGVGYFRLLCEIVMGQTYCLPKFRSHPDCPHQISFWGETSNLGINQTIVFPNEEFIFLFSWLALYFKVNISPAS